MWVLCKGMHYLLSLTFLSSRVLSFTALWMISTRYTGFTLRKAAISGTNDIMEEFRNRRRCYYVPVSTSRLGGELHRVWAERESLWLNRSTNTGVGGATSNVLTSQLTRAVRARKHTTTSYRFFSSKSKQLIRNSPPSADDGKDLCQTDHVVYARRTLQRLCEEACTVFLLNSFDETGNKMKSIWTGKTSYLHDQSWLSLYTVYIDYWRHSSSANDQALH